VKTTINWSVVYKHKIFWTAHRSGVFKINWKITVLVTVR